MLIIILLLFLRQHDCQSLIKPAGAMRFHKHSDSGIDKQLVKINSVSILKL